MSMFDKRKDSGPAGDDRPVGSRPAEPRTPMPNGVSAPRDIAVIGSTVTIKGDLTGHESLVIDGRVDGTVRMRNNDLTIGQSGRVEGDVAANVVRIEGQVTGDITGVERVVITRAGRVRGNVVAPRVALEEGAKFKGRIDMGPDPAQPAASAEALKPVPSGQPARARNGPGHDTGQV